MALMAEVDADGGEKRRLYIRLITMNPSNHGVTTSALFRGFVSKEIFERRKEFTCKLYLWEREVEFLADVTKPLWEHAYAVLKAEIGGEDVFETKKETV